MNELKVFENPAFGQVRTVVIDDEPWFVGKDVAQALGYKDTVNALKAHVDSEDKRGWRITTPSGEQQMTIINESGLYSLILSSKLPTAKEFKHWVTSEVLPSIRKHGAYMTPTVMQQVVDSPETIYQLAEALLNERRRADKLQPAADYAVKCLMAPDGILTTSIAKELGKSGQWLNKILHGLGIQYKCGKQWVLYAKYANKGYTVTRTTPITHKDGKPDIRVETLWTQTGKQFIYQQLKSNGFLDA